MNNLKVRLSDRILSVILAVVIVIGFFPNTVFASATSNSVLTTNIGQQSFKVGVPTEFTFTTKANDDAGVMVVGTSDFSEPSAVEKLEYLESKDGKWYEFSGDFGPSGGFPMSDATSRFRVTFKKSGNYSFTAAMKKVEDGSTLCSTTVSFTVNDKSKSTLTTDIGEKNFVIGEPTEFTFTTKANDDAGTLVVGSSDFGDSSAIEKLEYFETRNNTWYELNGDFGPSTGFPMSDATSRFRVTFKKAGDYTFVAAMKYADGTNKGEVLCTSGEIKFHVKDKYNITVNQTGNGTIKLNGNAVSSTGFTATEGDSVRLAVTPDAGWQISSVLIGGKAQVISDSSSFTQEITVNKDNAKIEVTFVKVYTVTVEYDSKNGTVNTSPESSGGAVTVIKDSAVKITATPKATFRVSGVEIVENQPVVFNDNTYNNSNPYITTLTADRDYTVKITFAPMVFNVAVTNETTANGSVEVSNDIVEYGKSATVTITPNDGYTIDKATVNGGKVYSSISETDDDSVFKLEINNIQEDKNIVISFKKSEAASVKDVSWNYKYALRSDNNLYVFAKNTKVSFETEKQGIRITDSNKNTYGGKDTKSIEISKSITISKIELRYDFGWHEIVDTNGSTFGLKLVFDEGKPVVSIKPKESANANGYYNKDAELTVSATDNGDYSGIEYVEYWVVCDGNKTIEPEKIYTYDDKEIKNEVILYNVKIIAEENNSENVTVYAKAVDRAGNVSDEVKLDLKFCVTTPAVTIEFNDKQSADANPNDTWYNEARTAKIIITDRADVFDETAATNGISFNEGSEKNYNLSNWETYENDSGKHFATITFADEGVYSWTYSYSNKADLQATVSKKGSNTDSFKIDTTSPSGTLNAQSKTWDEKGYDWSMLLEKITFGLYSNEEISVGLKNDTGSDNLSGFQKVNYYVSNEDRVLTESELIELYNKGDFKSDRVVVSNDSQFVVYARIADNAGNIIFIGTNGIIYDSTKSNIEINMIDAPNANSIYGVNQVKEYNKVLGIKADINVTDSDSGIYYSGIKKIAYTVEMGGATTQSDILFDFKNANPEKKDLVKDWSGSVIIDAKKNNGKNIKLTVTVTDNAGNESSNSVTINEINIDDITANVTMTGKAVTMEDGFGWYNAQREAFISIKDRASSFDPENVDIAFNITDKDGNPIVISKNDVQISDWNNNGDLHSATVTFIRDGKYSWNINYTNKAGNTLSENRISYENSESPKSFTIDKTAPHGKVTIGSYTWTDKILSVLTFGIYSKDRFSLKVEKSDEENISPVKVHYYIHNGAEALDKSQLDSLYNSGSFTADAPELSGAQQFTLYVRITDNAGNYIYVSSDGHVIDAKESELTVKAIDQPNENGFYGINEINSNSGIRVSVSAKEADSVDDVYSGIKEIRYEVKSRHSDKEDYTVTQDGVLYKFDYERSTDDNSNGGKLTITDANTGTSVNDEIESVPTKDMLCRNWAGVINVDVAPDKNNTCDVVVVVYVTDNSGNSKSESISLDIDITAPKISVSYDNNYAQNSTYFNAQRTATVVFTERGHHFDQAEAEKIITSKITATKLDNSEVKDAYTIHWNSDLKSTNPDDNTHTATVAFNKDAHYTFGVAYTDKAGNNSENVDYGSSVAPTDFTVDTEDPTGSVVINGNSWTKFFEILTFGLYSNSGATASATATDEISPVKIEYYKSNDDFGKKKVDLSSLKLISTGDYSIGKAEKLLEINETEQFNVYVKITDKAGHSVFVNSDGYIVDTADSLLSVTAVTKANENGVYGLKEIAEDGGVKLHIDANDTEDGAAKYYSGIASVSYSVSAELNGKMAVTQEETTLYEFQNKAPAKSELQKNWSGDILIDAKKNNSSKVLVTVTVKDNAGNVTTKTVPLDINISTPTIDISFDNNTALNDSYFNAARTATVVITERSNHFSSSAATNGITITAKDSNGNDVEDAYTISGWNNESHGANPDAATHTAKIVFKADANYTFEISYVGKSGNPNDKVNTGDSAAPYKFTVDTTVPEASISVNDHIWDKILNVLTFGLYSRVNAEVKVSAFDKTSPITIEYYKTNDPIVKSQKSLDALYSEGKFLAYKPFTVNTNEQFVVYVKITDNAGNYKYISSDGYIVDLVGPELTLTPDEPYNDTYNKDVNIQINTKDAKPYSGISKVEYWVVTDGIETQRQTLFNFDYTREDGDNINNGKLTITDWSDGTEKITNLTGNVPTQSQLYESWTGSFTVNAARNNSSDVKVYVGITDNAGNYTEDHLYLDIDITAPTIKVSYDDTSNENAKDGYYTARTATVEIAERTGHFDMAAATNGIEITAVDASGAEVGDAYTISAWKTVEGETPDSAIHTATINYFADANYTFAISYTDKAGNSNSNVNTDGQKNPYKFTVDNTAPVGTITAKSAEGREETWSSVVDVLTFGFWSNTKISITGTSDDSTSPIQSVEYYMPVSEIASDNTVVLKKSELDAVSEWKAFKAFDVTENTQFSVYLKITDNAGNYTYISTNGLIVDEEHPVEESVAPEISVSPVKPVNGIYSDDVKVSIEVVDPMVGGTYSGLKEVSYAVYDRDSATPDKPTQEGTLFTFDMAYPKQSDLKQKWTGEITVSAAKNNSNNIQVVVYAKDNSLNAVDNSQKESKSYTVIKIDTTAPVINIAYDNNNADSGTYFKANRKATVTISERNFNAEDVKISIANTHGTVPSVIGWSHSMGTYNNDNATHTATITYSADGDYTFAIEYTDLAGNKCTNINYASGTVAGTSFTVDKTIPTINVSYDNNSAQNSNYYKDSRTATIVINEHNFSTDRISVKMTATDDGTAVSIPTVNGWTNNGDTHTATVTFANDALYTFDIDYTDLAGNSAADYSQDTFYVDKTAPVLEITGVENQSANNGTVIPIVTYSDTNFDANQVKITLTGANRNDVKLIGNYSDIHNGQVFTFADFAKEKSIDDIYTLTAMLTDKAGNSTTKAISFSVNRFGSAYSLDENTGKLNNSYVKEAQDVVVTEINANALSNIKIVLFKNNETIVLKEGSDYRITITGGNGQWNKYVYTIFKKNFADDGVYRLSIHSEDAAGNIAENTLDTKNMEINFGVDSTLPTININNLESGTTYALDSLTVKMSVGDNLNLTKVIVYLDGNEYASWSGEALSQVISDGGNFSFDIAGDSTDSHILKVVAVDAAGNELIEEVKDFYVTTNLWVRYYNNKWAFYGSISGVIVLSGLIVFLVVWKRRKDEKNVTP